jgi:hypothetical protein
VVELDAKKPLHTQVAFGGALFQTLVCLRRES